MILGDFKVLRDRMLRIANVSEDAFIKERKYPMFYVRAIVAERLRDKGYIWEDIAKCFQKSHSTLVLGQQKLKDALKSKQFVLVNRIYNEFNNDKVMLEIKNEKVYDLKESVISCRNAMRLEMPEYTDEEFQKSLPRAIQLANTTNGSGHQNFLKGIRVSFDIKYPNYISPELQRYNWVDIVTSSSKMHRLLKMDLDKSCNKYVTEKMILELQDMIDVYNSMVENNTTHGIFFLRDGSSVEANTHSDCLYRQFMKIISNCPQGVELFMRVSTNYLQLKTIWHQRKHHKLQEDWGAVCDFIEGLPYAKEFGLCK